MGGNVEDPKMSVSQGESDIDISSFIVPQVLLKADSASTVSSDHFFEEDLVWPDPENVFPKTSGIKPSVLCSELKHINVGGMELQPKTRCQLALVVRKRPRPKSLPWNVVVIDSDPPIIEPDDVEEYLVHDPLFVEFFNAFLALPSFPEPVCFNVESGGFEVGTDGKLKLAQQIKEAVRSQKTKNDMYERTHQHAFSDIPVVPIEDTQGPDEVQIETTFDVTALNKEQGIKWVKAARLPIFLESDYYFEYRLAKVISQASIFNENGEFVVMKIDYTTKPKTKKKAVEVQPPTQEELIMKQMFVSFGDLKGAAKEAWFTQAKKQLKTEPTFSSLGPKISPTAAGDSAYTTKPSKKTSVFNSHYFGVYLPGLVGPNETEPPIHDKMKIEDCRSSTERPFTPRPSDRIHAATSMLRAKLSNDPNADDEMVPAGHVVFVWPKQDFQSMSADSNLIDKADREADFAKRMKEHQIIDQIYNDGSWEEGGTGNIVLKSVDELGSVIVGAVMKKTIAGMLNKNEENVVEDPAISSIYPTKDLTCVSVDKLHLCVVVEASESDNDLSTTNTSYVEVTGDVENLPDREPVHVKWKKPVRKPAEEDPQEESLLDSDEDFEERDIHFRRNKDRWHSLTTVKGIQAFKKFLMGTQGEKYWELWIDIDKGRLIRNEEEKQKYIMLMRDRYYKKGSQFELSAENKRKLDLVNLSQWIPEHLFKVQARVLEPLVLYWAPRYLLSHLIHTNPEQYFLYNELKLSIHNPASDPYPHTQELLPLRPKSCCPRSTSGHGAWEMNYDTYNANISDLGTTPKVGNRRVYGKDTIQRLANTPTAKYLKVSKYTKKAAKPAEVQEHLRTSLARVKTSLHSRGLSETSSEVANVGEVADQFSQRDVPSYTEIIPSSLGTVSQTGPADLPKREHSNGAVKIPCPYKAVLLSSKERPHTSFVPDKKPKELLFPAIKTGGVKGENCKGIKSAPVRRVFSQETADYTFFRQESKESRKSCEQYRMEGHMSSEEAQMVEDRKCDFLGSERMEFLLQVLHHEQASGRAFRKFIEKKKREDWLNNLDFWEKVQEYRKLFYKDKLDLHFITKNARLIFAQCIVDVAPQRINVPEHIKLFILDHLSPPHEELFDRAEENALRILFEACKLYITEDIRSYCEVERAITQHRLETRNPHILDLQKKGIIKERPLTPDDPMEGYVDQVYDDSVLARVPEEYRNWDMAKLAQVKLELEYFRQFLIPRCAEIDLKCWMDMEAWRRTDPTDRIMRDQRARDIKKNYLNKKYFFGPNSPAGKDGQNKVMEVGGGWGKFLEDKPHFNSILKAQKYVRARLEKKHLPFFLISEDFQERHLVDSSMPEEEKDAYTFHKKRSLALMRVISEGEEAFESILDQKEKLLADLGSEEGSIHYSGIGAESVPSLTGTKSEKSVQAPLPVLPPIKTKGAPIRSPIKPHAPRGSRILEGEALPKRGHKKGTTFKHAARPSDAYKHHDEETPKDRPPSKQSSKASASKKTDRQDRPSISSKWDYLLYKHAMLITPMGLINRVIRLVEYEQPNESKWITAAREIFLLQKALKNPTSRAQFKKFVSLSGGYLENDILFWLEVQKYKKMHHNHGEEIMVQRKISAIVSCFINSYLPPSLQIDISQELADNIMERRHDLSPYLFRQAELTAFRGLLPHWVAFREYHKRLGIEDKILQTLDRHRAVAYTKELKYREKLAQDRENERLYRLQHPSGSDEQEADEEGKDTLAFSYSDYLAQQEDLYSKGTQTVRYFTAAASVSDPARIKKKSRGSSVMAMSRSGQGFCENGDEQLDILTDKFDLKSRRSSEQNGKKIPPVISGVTSSWAKEKVRGVAQRVKKSQATHPASAK